jgi:FdhD protein
LLYNEGIISSLHEITDISSSSDLIEILLPQKDKFSAKTITSSLELHLHGLFLHRHTDTNIQIKPDELFKIQNNFFENQKLFEITGGTHCAAAFDKNGTLISFAEDTGRHNALDKITGKALLIGRIQDIAIVMLSSRLSFEMIKKSYRTGALIIAGVSAPTSAAIDAAADAGITLIGFLRTDRFNLYSHQKGLMSFKIKTSQNLRLT